MTAALAGWGQAVEKRKAVYEAGNPGRGHSRVRLRDHLAVDSAVCSFEGHLQLAWQAASSAWLTSKPESLCTMGGVPAGSSRVTCLCSSFAKMMSFNLSHHCLNTNTSPSSFFQLLCSRTELGHICQHLQHPCHPMCMPYSPNHHPCIGD